MNLAWSTPREYVIVEDEAEPKHVRYLHQYVKPTADEAHHITSLGNKPYGYHFVYQSIASNAIIRFFYVGINILITKDDI